MRSKISGIDSAALSATAWSRSRNSQPNSLATRRPTVLFPLPMYPTMANGPPKALEARPWVPRGVTGRVVKTGLIVFISGANVSHVVGAELLQEHFGQDDCNHGLADHRRGGHGASAGPLPERARGLVGRKVHSAQGLG